MKREIKFRYIIKHKATNNLISFEVTLKDIEKYEGFWWMASMITGIPENGEFNYELVETLEYTGLKDKNGKEIYEADIMKFDNGHKVSISFVVWGLDGWRFNSWMGLGRMDLYPYAAAQPSQEPKAEIIGNMYESPELLHSDLKVQECDASKAK